MTIFITHRAFQRFVYLFLLFLFSISLNASELYITTADLNLRSGAGSKYSSLGIIKNGDTINVIERTSDLWFKVNYNNKIGYLSTKFLTPIIIKVETPELQPPVKEPIKEESFSTMYVIGLIIIVGIFLIYKGAKPKKEPPIEYYSPPKKETNSREQLKEKLVNQIMSNIKIEIKTTSTKDDSIIDVTGNSYQIKDRIEYPISLNNKMSVPAWKHQYVYSYKEILSASALQKEFYFRFKINFLNGIYFDLEGNSNYAFILLFDLINEYQDNKDITKLESQFQALERQYPITAPYTSSFIKTKKNNGQTSNIQTQQGIENQNNNDYDYWKLGSKYKKKLNLSSEEEILLNNLWYSSNNFCSIDFCCIEILKLYLDTIKALKDKYIEEGSTLEQKFKEVADVIAKKHFKYRTGSYNYNHCINSMSNEFYSNIFKHCENAVREVYGHKRKINTDTYFTATDEAKVEFETNIIVKVTEILSELVLKVSPPDEATEIELYSQNTSRWKIKFDELVTNYKNNSKEFIDNITLLGNLNKKNPSIENIFFEASKFISKSDKEAALTLYIYYLYYDLKSASFDNKQLTKTIQKNLFKTNEQLHDFEIIVSELVKNKNLEKALEAVSKIYLVKRKKIQLDTESIKEVQEQHSGTVELLNEYLKDEYESDVNTIKTKEINNEEVEIEITQKNQTGQNSTYINGITFTPIHTEALEMFTKSNFSISQSDLEIFAKSKGVFKNQLIESINEICYENLDDVLIEEDEEYYIINENYYQKLLAK